MYKILIQTRLRLFRSIVLLISMVWVAEDLVEVFLPEQAAHMEAVEIKTGEKLEKLEENETKDYLESSFIPTYTYQPKLKAQMISKSYQSPVIAVLDLPPENI